METLCCKDGQEGEANYRSQTAGGLSRLRFILRKVWDYLFTSPLFEAQPRSCRSFRWLIYLNLFEMVTTVAAGILVFELSTQQLLRKYTSTLVFPLYLPHAWGLGIATNHQGSVVVGNFVGFYIARTYIANRAPIVVSTARYFAMILFTLFGTLEVHVAAWYIKKYLCPASNPSKKWVTIDNVRQACYYIAVVVLSSLTFQTLIAVFECLTTMVLWGSFLRYWGTWWLGVVAAMFTITPAIMHIHALGRRPWYSATPSVRNVIKSVVLWLATLGFLVLVFVFSVRSLIRTLPYLLFPLVIIASFRFNRVGWAIVVAVISIFAAVGTLHRNSSLYYMAGAPQDKSSPSLILQIEFFVSVLGLVGIVLAAAVKEKNQLTRDLNKMNEDLEKTVGLRTKELVKANEELQVSQRNAELASHAKSNFLANMSHEIRTPIHGIMGLTMLLLESELSADQKDSLVSVKECADLLLHIINSVLDLAKIEAGRLEVETVPFSIRRMVSSTLRMLQVRAQDRGLRLLWEVENNVPDLLVGDPGKLQQCLLNLVGNALKFTNKGTVTVRVALTREEESAPAPASDSKRSDLRPTPENSIREPISTLPLKQATTLAKLRSWSSWPGTYFKGEHKDMHDCTDIDAYDRKSTVGLSRVAPIVESVKPVKTAAKPSKVVQIEFMVQDTGIGINRDNLQDMFNPFTQADPSTSRLYGGTGLGLCIVQRFVELLGGTIGADSEVGKGSTFHFQLPFRPIREEDCSFASDEVDGRPVRFSSLGAWPVPKISGTSNFFLHRRAQSLSVLIQGVKFSLPPYPPHSEGNESLGDSGHPSMKPVDFEPTFKPSPKPLSPFKEFLRGSLPISRGETLLLLKERGLYDREDARHSKDIGMTAGAMLTRKHDSSQLNSKLTKGLKPDQGGKLLTEKLARSSASEFILPRNLPEHELASPVQIPQKPTDKNILEQLKRTAKYEKPSPDSAQPLEGQSYTPNFVQKVVPPDEIVIEVADGKEDTPVGLNEREDSLKAAVKLQSESSSRPQKSTSIDIDAREPSPHRAQSSGESLLEKGEASKGAPLLHNKKLGFRGRVLPSSSPPTEAEKLRILLAEDNPINQKVATRQLQRYGHEVTIVGDGRQALETVRLNHEGFDLVLMDVQMPNMDGLQATEHIREVELQQRWTRLPILGLTAHAIQGYQEICLSHGMDGYLGKPFDIKVLLKQMKEMVAVVRSVSEDHG